MEQIRASLLRLVRLNHKSQINEIKIALKSLSLRRYFMFAGSNTEKNHTDSLAYLLQMTYLTLFIALINQTHGHVVI
jgi:hypothetical protein